MMSSTAASGLVTVQDPASSSPATLARRFDELMSANGAALARLAASYTTSASDRDDLLQDIAMALWQALPKFREECSDRTFLFRIAHNRAIAYLSRRRHRPVSPGEKSEIPDVGLDPETAMVHKEKGERLLRAIRLLPVLYRQVITLTLEEMEYSEIAEILGISESNVGVRLNRARQMLRKSLEEQK